jgi:hypothetical protein
LENRQPYGLAEMLKKNAVAPKNALRILSASRNLTETFSGKTHTAPINKKGSLSYPEMPGGGIRIRTGE